ncbi:MAG: HD-GYP domain-containing protein [Lysobacteraceae bacterium]|nr:MAG: HD-GYP domain-containing protein [Xanthomonadaceae bacterium]
MTLEERRILVGLLQKGMFVSRLDRDWIGTPFPFQGFHVESDQDIEMLGNFCTSVFVDVVKGVAPSEALLTLERSTSPVFPPRVADYVNTVPLQEETPRARKAHAILHHLAATLEEDVRAGRRVSSESVRSAVEPMVDSLLRNADSLFWLISMMRRDDYAYLHAVNCSALAAAFGRHLALPKDVLVELATGGFLLDIGMTVLPRVLVDPSGVRSADDGLRMRDHVAAGLDVLEKSGINGGWTRDMLAHHHERHDGCGYPGGLAGAAIPLAGRIAGIVDTYDALISDKPTCRGDSQHGALQAIYRGSDSLFQGEVVEQFLQCLSVYPTGSLVELNSGEVAIVMAQNQARRLQPRVMVLLDANKRPYRPYHDVDLMALRPRVDGGAPTRITHSLERGTYGLDPAELYLA